MRLLSHSDRLRSFFLREDFCSCVCGVCDMWFGLDIQNGTKIHRWANRGKWDYYVHRLKKHALFPLPQWTFSSFFSFFFSPSKPWTRGGACLIEYHWLVQMQASLASAFKNLCLRKLVLYQRHCRTTGNPESFHDVLFLHKRWVQNIAGICFVHASMAVMFMKMAKEWTFVKMQHWCCIIFAGQTAAHWDVVLLVLFCPCSAWLRNL